MELDAGISQHQSDRTDTIERLAAIIIKVGIGFIQNKQHGITVHRSGKANALDLPA